MKARPPEAPYAFHVIARIRNDFPTKFGLPRQSGLIDSLVSQIVFEPEYRSPVALRGLEGYTHLWLIWGFSGARRAQWSATVRPPRLGGNARMGVFATRSPYRPNPVGLSCVRLLAIDADPPQGPVLRVAGADMMDGTPIFDIKPYLPYTDSHPDAKGGFTQERAFTPLEVVFPEPLLSLIPDARRPALLAALAGDPRPAYHSDPARVYGFTYAGLDVRFTVTDGVLTVVEVVPPEGR